MIIHFQNPSLPEEPALETEEANPRSGPSSGKQMGPVSRFFRLVVVGLEMVFM